nr:MAG TPA: hypothetical protein [Caudoviricetes sp.]
MTNLLVLFLGAIMMVVAMVCANSVEMFRATVCVSLILINALLIFFVSTVVKIGIEAEEDDDDEEK